MQQLPASSPAERFQLADAKRVDLLTQQTQLCRAWQRRLLEIWSNLQEEAGMSLDLGQIHAGMVAGKTQARLCGRSTAEIELAQVTDQIAWP